MWRPKSSNRFKHGYSRLSDEMAKRVQEAIRIILSSPNPERLGVPKKKKWKSYFAWELGRSCRILYKPNYNERIIEFIRVCSHKEVYGP